MPGFRFNPLSTAFVPGAEWHPPSSHCGGKRHAKITDLPPELSAAILRYVGQGADFRNDEIAFPQARPDINRAIEAVPGWDKVASGIQFEDQLGWVRYEPRYRMFCYERLKRWAGTTGWLPGPSPQAVGTIGQRVSH
ncbi:hypothetical protein LTR70_006324 [Exophiala xenobiotica]|uniref:Uncharacterized protein n=1 Tax=Lithohypha guttulata TaxID=1690604 RepID=A0ABR0K853_9EURO|nr:hypothetical protein LTR24_005793 [Lithohypha guttulata]KAK5316269.1 hypothetical protein LTR70_006324 [Exophiala xenobiotica]